MVDKGLPGRTAVTIRPPSRGTLRQRQAEARTPVSSVELVLKMPEHVFRMLSADSRRNRTNEPARAIAILEQVLSYRLSNGDGAGFC
jgi:hypothetical protein